MSKTAVLALSLPAEIKSEAEEMAAADGTSLHDFLATAVAEKVTALRAASYLEERRGQTVWQAIQREP